jgi:addiction module RelB/DinJ family antitoxin
VATEYFQIRVNEELKNKFDALCKKKGLKTSMAIRIFVKNFIKSGNLAYDFNSDRNFNESNSVRVSFRMESGMRELFAVSSEKIGLPMSVLIRGYMDACVTAGQLSPVNPHNED